MADLGMTLSLGIMLNLGIVFWFRINAEWGTRVWFGGKAEIGGNAEFEDSAELGLNAEFGVCAELGCRRPCISSAVPAPSAPPPRPCASSRVTARTGKGRDGRREGMGRGPFKSPPRRAVVRAAGPRRAGDNGAGRYHCGCREGGRGEGRKCCAAPPPSPRPPPARRGGERCVRRRRRRVRFPGHGSGQRATGSGRRRRRRRWGEASNPGLEGGGARSRGQDSNPRPPGAASTLGVLAAAPQVAAARGPHRSPSPGVLRANLSPPCPLLLIPPLHLRAPPYPPHPQRPQYQTQPSHVPLTPSPPIAS